MSHPHEGHSRVDRRLLDRLVDGELGDRERAELLRRLETEPDGWRRCALAFLEAQAWRESFAPLAARTSNSKPIDVPASEGAACRDVAAPTAVRAGRGARSAGRAAAMAAAILAAFLLGWSAGRYPRPDAQGRDVARDHKGRATERSPLADVARGEKPSPPSASERSRGPAHPFIDERWLTQMPTPLPEPVLRQLERSGYQVDQQQYLISMGLDDGRSVALPMDEIHVRFVGDRTY